VTTGKRIFDIAIGIAGLILLWPVLLLIAILVKAEDGGDVLFRQERVGRDGRPFGMWKFRTMITDPENLGPQLTAAHDERITTAGALLRQLRLDELPQLFNVIVGEMSMVGPRPEVPKYVASYTTEQRRVLELTPGITDRASIEFLDEAGLLRGESDPEKFYIDRIMPEKIRLNLEYAGSATRWRDLMVIIDTLRRILPRERPAPAKPRAIYFPAISEP
jgi:lipopolysaccharide/colanic/teichoic acid biosynthesis glycosyltransferase